MRPRSAPAARRLLRPASLALALTAVAGCTSGPGAVAPSASVVQRLVGAAAASSPVAELQAGLTALLVERAYVVAAVTETVAADGDTAADLQGALAALDANSTALADLLGATYSEARTPLLAALRRDDVLLGRHAVALGTGDRKGAALVRPELVDAQRELARVVRRVVPKLDAQEVATGLGAEVQAQLAAGSYEQLHRAGQEAAGTARLLAAGIASDRRLGSSATPAVRLRSDLTGLLTEHVMLTAALARELRVPGAGSVSARTALQVNATLLADLIGDAYAAAGGAFLRSWTPHLDRLERYAAARAGGGTALAERTLVLGYPAELARLLAEHVRGFPAQSAQAELAPALAAQLDAIEEAAGASVSAPGVLREAVAAVLPTAALLSAAVAEDLRLS